jgi:glutamate-1-semialdehyde 2,1-aminomutase
MSSSSSRAEIPADGPAAVTEATEVRPKISAEKRLQIEKENRALLEQDLLGKSLVFASRPYEAYIQYSNFCNMSCIMCHDGSNPPLRKMSPEILKKVGEQVAPSLSVVIPHGGSEPLIVAWDETRGMAEQYGFELDLTTNVQFLDEKKFDELKDITQTLFFSFDSHIPELFEKIRVGGKPEQVFANLPIAARLAGEHGVECLANVVFMTENAATLPETVAYLADIGVPTVNVLQMIDVNGRSGMLDPLIHFSADYVESIKQRCIRVANENHIRLIWNAGGWERHDFRQQKVAPKPRKDWNVRWEKRMKHYVPGYCLNVWNRLQIMVDGAVTPCCYAVDGDLVLGQLDKQDFDSVWNGPNARDLRRGHMTWDHPSLCKTCRFTDKLPPETYLPFVEDVLESIDHRRENVDPTLIVRGPAHMTRQAEAPSIQIDKPAHEVDSFLLALSLGGEDGQIEVCPLEPAAEADGVIEFAVPVDVWERLRSNLGYWWALFAICAQEPDRVLRSAEIRCLVRHEDIARLEESTLRYPDQGHLPLADLGGEKQAGWIEPLGLPPRPRTGPRRAPSVSGQRHRRRRQEDAATPERLDATEYEQLIRQIRKMALSALPADSTVLVASKGDDELVKLDCHTVWHFPTGADGSYAGHHPADSEWAIEHLEQARARGADYLVLPATLFWWLEHYPEFAHHLSDRYPLVVDDDACAVFALGPRPALYGRSREGMVRRHDQALAERLPTRKHLRTYEERTAPNMSANRSNSSPTSAPDTAHKAHEVLAYGGHHRVLMRPLYEDEEGVFPEFAEEASGYELIDSTGRSFVDWWSGAGPVLLGYRRPEVEEAIREQLKAGPTLSLMHQIEVEVASMLIEMIPCAEMVAFGKNGSDVTTAAVRVARASTGRDLIFQHGFHGFHDWYTCQYRQRFRKGVPKVLRSFVHRFAYNDLPGLEELFGRFPGEVAAVVMEPLNVALPEPGYLEAVEEMAHRNGALLVFDELVTGFRLANGGAQELFGVSPDLACFGKGMANGMPLAAIVGKREYMRHLPDTAYGMTFRGETLSLAAARAVLRILQEEPVVEHLARIGSELRDGFQAACADEGIRCELIGPPARMTFAFEDAGGISPERLRTLFVRECARNGVLTNGTLLPTYAHDQEAVDRTLRAFSTSLKSVGEAIGAGRQALEEAVRAGFVGEQSSDRGARNGEPAALPNGRIDVIHEEGPSLKIVGWMLLEDGCPDSIEFVGPDGERRLGKPFTRPDIAETFPHVPGAEDSGYFTSLPASLFAAKGDYDFTIRATRGDRTVFSCRLVHGRESAESERPPAPYRAEDGTLRL